MILLLHLSFLSIYIGSATRSHFAGSLLLPSTLCSHRPLHFLLSSFSYFAVFPFIHLHRFFSVLILYLYQLLSVCVPFLPPPCSPLSCSSLSRLQDLVVLVVVDYNMQVRTLAMVQRVFWNMCSYVPMFLVRVPSLSSFLLSFPLLPSFSLAHFPSFLSTSALSQPSPVSTNHAPISSALHFLQCLIIHFFPSFLPGAPPSPYSLSLSFVFPFSI